MIVKKKYLYWFIAWILDSYLRQYVCVMWDSCKSEYFQMYNGVKQGGVISCHLFNLYIDPLIVQLSNSDYGCHIAYNIYISCTMKHEVSKIKTRNELTYDQLALVKNLKTFTRF